MFTCDTGGLLSRMVHFYHVRPPLCLRCPRCRSCLPCRCVLNQAAPPLRCRAAPRRMLPSAPHLLSSCLACSTAISTTVTSTAPQQLPAGSGRRALGALWPAPRRPPAPRLASTGPARCLPPATAGRVPALHTALHALPGEHHLRARGGRDGGGGRSPAAGALAGGPGVGVWGREGSAHGGATLGAGCAPARGAAGRRKVCPARLAHHPDCRTTGRPPSTASLCMSCARPRWGWGVGGWGKQEPWPAAAPCTAPLRPSWPQCALFVTAAAPLCSSSRDTTGCRGCWPSLSEASHTSWRRTRQAPWSFVAPLKSVRRRALRGLQAPTTTALLSAGAPGKRGRISACAPAPPPCPLPSSTRPPRARRAEQRGGALAVPQRTGVPRRAQGGAHSTAVVRCCGSVVARRGPGHHQLHARLPLLAHAIGAALMCRRCCWPPSWHRPASMCATHHHTSHRDATPA